MPGAGDPQNAPGSARDEAGRDATTAGTGAGTVSGRIAIGAPGAVSTSSATLYSHASVYRQVDLEAIPGLGPRIGTMLRDAGTDTFAKLAALPPSELDRLVSLAGADPRAVDAVHGPELATLAAGHDWAGFAALAERSGLRLLQGSGGVVDPDGADPVPGTDPGTGSDPGTGTAT